MLISISLGGCISRQDSSIGWLDASSLAHDGFDGAIKATLALMTAFSAWSLFAVILCLCKRSVKKAELCCIAVSNQKVNDGLARAWPSI